MGACPSQSLAHAAAPAQLCSQLSRFWQSVLAVHASSDVQQLDSAHCVHWASAALIGQLLELAPLSSGVPAPPPTTPAPQLAPSLSQGPRSGGLDGVSAQAERTSHASGAATGTKRGHFTRELKHPGVHGTRPPVVAARPFVGN